MKTGVNFEDLNRIKEWAAQGKDATFISQALKIEARVIAKFIPEGVTDGEQAEEEASKPRRSTSKASS